MARFVLFLILLVPVVVAGNWLIANPGRVQMDWLGYAIDMPVAMLATLFFVGCGLITLLVLLLVQIAGWPERRRARKRYRTLAKGLTQLTHGVTALALGDESAAQSALKKAMAALPNEPLPRLLTAQLLQRQGEHEAARTHLRALLNHESTAMLASKRLIEQHTERAEWDAAIELAEQVREDSPREHWLVVALIDLYARKADTRAMLNLTEGFQWQSPLSKDERHHFAGLAHYLQSRQAEPERNRRHALRHAVGYTPDFLPALLDYALLLLDENEPRQARKWLLSAWLSRPRSILIDPILRAVSDASPRAQQRLLRPYLTGDTLAHQLLRAKFQMQMNDHTAAEQLLESTIAREESREACLLMAELEKKLRGEEAANRWLSRAMRAPADEGWICNECGTLHARWEPHCKSCGVFDSIGYTRPEARITSVELATA